MSINRVYVVVVVYLALINRAGALYRRILIEVVSKRKRGQDSSIQTHLA